MMIIPDWDALERALRSPLDASLKAILSRYRDQLADCQGMTVRFVVVTPGDAPEHIDPPPLINPQDGSRFGEPGWLPAFEHVQDHGGWLAIVTVTADDGSGAIVLVQDTEGMDATLLKLCRAFAQ